MNLSKLSKDANPMTESENPLWWSWISHLQTSTTILWLKSKPKHKHKLNPHFSCRERKKHKHKNSNTLIKTNLVYCFDFDFDLIWFFMMCYGHHQTCSRDSLTSSTNPMRDWLITERAQSPQHTLPSTKQKGRV